MPFRAELKRPDLKGTFPCTVCGKIFCHSSSLSRHRMQAHFKSYTCTLCNTEISSNETLRSHMFRSHDISRMFMCRCCNWAFPDKTSLHIHMQSMMRHGQPGDVNILAKSSTEGGSPIPSSPITTSASMLHDTSGNSPSPINHSYGFGGKLSPTDSPSLVPPPSSISASIFPVLPAMPSREELMSRLRARAAQGLELPSTSTEFKADPMSAVTNQLQAALNSAASGMTQSNPLMGLAGPSALSQQNLLASWLANNFRNFGVPSSANSPKNNNCDLDSPDMGGNHSVHMDSMKMEEGNHANEDDDDDRFHNSYPSGTNGGEGSLREEGTNNNPSVPRVEPQDSGADGDDSLPILRSTIMSNPLQSLMYGKKLNTALRNRHSGNHQPALTNFLMAVNGESRNGHSTIGSLLHQDQNNGIRSGNGEGGNRPTPGGDDIFGLQHSQASPAASDSQTSSTGAPLSAGSDGSSPQKCFECQVTKGKLNMAENRNKFLENKVSSLENKIARMESRIAGLESNARRFEGEHKVLRDHSEVLERKLLNCQEKALRYMQESGTNNNLDNTKLMKDLLEDLLQYPATENGHSGILGGI